MEITSQVKFQEPYHLHEVDAVLVEAADCTLEVTESITGTQVTIKRGSARIVNEEVVEEKPSRPYHWVYEIYSDATAPTS